MSYFDEVYLKRMNINGNTRQERAETRKEIEFEKLFLQHTQYQAKIYGINDQEADILTSLQPNKWNETKLLSNILVSKKTPSFKTGDMLRIFQKIKDIEYDKIWLILLCEENIGKGYLAYKAICLDSQINITNEYGDTQMVLPVKFINSSESFFKDSFYFTAAAEGYREPLRNIRLITQSNPILKKELYFNYNNKGFEISAVDDISIHGVSYVSITERLMRFAEPRTSEDIMVGLDENFFLNNS